MSAYTQNKDHTYAMRVARQEVTPRVSSGYHESKKEPLNNIQPRQTHRCWCGTQEEKPCGKENQQARSRYGGDNRLIDGRSRHSSTQYAALSTRVHDLAYKTRFLTMQRSSRPNEMKIIASQGLTVQPRETIIFPPARQVIFLILRMMTAVRRKRKTKTSPFG